MKIPLKFQTTDYDCGTVSLINALSYLYEREEIPAELLRGIELYSLDEYGNKFDAGSGGTSKEAMSHITRWINNYSSKNDFDLCAVKLEESDVNQENISKYLKKGAVIVARYYMMGAHYSIITKEDDENLYIFDTQYVDEKTFDRIDEVEIIFDKPFEYNRIVKKTRFYDITVKNYALGKIDKRECFCLYRKQG